MIKVSLPQFISVLFFLSHELSIEFVLIHHHLPSEWVHKILDNIVSLRVSYHQIKNLKIFTS